MTAQDKARALIAHPAALGWALGYKDFKPNLHGEWIRWIVTGEKDGTLQAHRGSYKTTCLSLAIAALMALRPEKTIADLSWAGGEEDSVIDDKGNVTKKAKAPYLPENDRALPRATRMLARSERLAGAAADDAAAKSRAAVVAALEPLYVAALKEDRVVDADFYRKSLLSMYPDWELTVSATNAPASGGAAK